MRRAEQIAAWTARPPVALLVDRDADTRKMYAEYLATARCVVDEAEDGREALAKAIARQPSVIVTETRLPGISGFDLCALLRSDPQTLHIPIIVVTADAYTTDQHRAQLAGADAVLVKPCLPATLLEEIQRLIDRPEHERAATSHPDPGAIASVDDRPANGAAGGRRVMLSRVHHRQDTTTPPITPPVLVCPHCDQPLRYVRSHVGGVSERHQEQWDYYECAAGCGTYQYRERTKRLRKV
jgi:CheY-like chemotaxis protein